MAKTNNFRHKKYIKLINGGGPNKSGGSVGFFFKINYAGGYVYSGPKSMAFESNCLLFVEEGRKMRKNDEVKKLKKREKEVKNKNYLFILLRTLLQRDLFCLQLILTYLLNNY